LRLVVNKKDRLHLNKLLSLLEINGCEACNFDDLWHSKILIKQLRSDEYEFLNSIWEVVTSDASTFHFEKCLSVMQSYCNTVANFANDNERSIMFNDYLAYREHWQTYVRQSTLEERSLSDMLRSIALGLSTPEEQHGLTLSTVHMSKGLEFDVVFIVGMNERVFPDYRATDKAQLSEEQHSMFVSITRAKRLCFITYPLRRRMPWGDTKSQLPSRYITALQDT